MASWVYDNEENKSVGDNLEALGYAESLSGVAQSAMSAVEMVNDVYRDARALVESHEEIGGLTILLISGSFSAHKGSMNLTYSISGYQDGKSYEVKGPNFPEIIEEYVRRVQADKRLAPLMLPRA